MIEKNNKNLAVNTFIYAFTFFSVYTLICFLVVLATQTDFWLFLPGYGIGIYTLISPILLFVYGAVYLAYKKYLRANISIAVLYFNFIYLSFLFGSLVYELIFYKDL